MRPFERGAQRHVTEHHPARGARRGAVAFGPLVQDTGLDVEHLVGPALGHGGHSGVNRLGLQHEQLALGRALLGGVQREAGRAPLHHRHRPRRVGVRPVGVADEAGVQRLDPGQTAGAEVSGVLGGRSR